ncbi:ABC transporter substrate-binding protein [Pseudomonas sp. PDM20]|uniref:ABC transporter substrate-binding protein n=1 Tax=Pseudomonas sp. PDM20 TaxID=2769254 RepID=UPI00178176FE|nr:ABC transporter substrate-binding protein [Pseudomonas sp. PDM20]MBD9685218.1 ABC transporter substrate-binding protein [Pseudomonas sp. PDM20]
MSARRSWTSLGTLLSALLLGLACLFALPAQARDILLVSTEQSQALQDFAEALAQRRPHDQVRLESPENLPPAASLDGETRLLLLGSGALNWRLASDDAPPALTLLVSRVEARQVLGEREPPHLSLLWSDPPPARQLQLALQLSPRPQRIGVLIGPSSEFLLEELQRSADQLGVELVSELQTRAEDSRPLRELLGRSDLLLGLDDKQLYNAQTIKGILLSAYAENRALIGPTAAFVKAGSLASSYSDQSDWLETLDTLLDEPAEQWPRSLYPERFKVQSNRQVARSLGIDLQGDAELAQRLAEGEKP